MTSATHLLQPGDTIDAWFVESHLGSGGMGSVFRCHNKLVPDILAALKVVRPTGGILKDRERFFREVKALHSLRHASVVRVSGWGEDVSRGLLWMAMDLVEGHELSSLIAEGPSDPATVLSYLRPLAEALDHAHQRGTFHRDIKPANIIIDGGRPMLVDFGISVQAGDARLTQTGMFVGTPSYMPPEVFDGDVDDDAAAEVYALGQVMWELLKGAEAFPGSPSNSTGRRMVALMAAKMKSEALDPGEGTPEPLRSVIRSMTAFEPSHRPSDMQAVLRGLDDISTLPAFPSGPAPAPPNGTPAAPQTEWVRRQLVDVPRAQATPAEPAPSVTDVPGDPPADDVSDEYTPAKKSTWRNVAMFAVGGMVLLTAVGGGALWAAGMVPPIGNTGKAVVVGTAVETTGVTPEVPEAEDPREVEARHMLTEATAMRMQLASAKAATVHLELVTHFPETEAVKTGVGPEIESLALVGHWTGPLNVTWLHGTPDERSADVQVLMLWEAWCDDCNAGLAKLTELHQRYKDQGVRVFALSRVSRSTTDDDVRRRLSEASVPFPVGKVPSQALSDLGDAIRPSSVLILRDDRIVWHGTADQINDNQMQRARRAGADKLIGSTLETVAEVVQHLASKPALPHRAPTPPPPPVKAPLDKQQLKERMAQIEVARAAGDVKKALALARQLVADDTEARVVKNVKRTIAELEVVGKRAAPLEVERWLTAPGSLSAGKATVLLFWEPWCPHCKRELPRMASVFNKRKAAGLNVIGMTSLSKNSTAEQAVELVRSHAVSFPVAHIGPKQSKYYAVTGVPAAAVIKGGKVIWRGHPGRISDAQLDAWLR